MAQQSMSAFETTPAQDTAIRARNRARARSHAWMSHLTPTLGKAVRAVAKVRGGGSSFPGMVVEKADPGFLPRTIGQMPLGALVVSGTNGKTTTTRMIASMLRSLGLKVFTNPTGANFVRGVISSLIPEVSASGAIDADIAVLELDEAYSVKFVQQVQPRFAVLLNVMRDQLDRFGEIDTTARLLSHVAAATTGTVVLNREDGLVAGLARYVGDPTGQGKGQEDRKEGYGKDHAAVTDGQQDAGHGEGDPSVSYFGLASDELRAVFPNDADIHGALDGKVGSTPVSGSVSAPAPAFGAALPADVALAGVHIGSADFDIAGTRRSTPVRLSGVYNLFNAAAALTAVRAVVADAGRCASDPGSSLSTERYARLEKCASADDAALLKALSTVTPAFGRGETINVNGTPVEMVLVKNPGGFRLALRSFPAAGTDTMIAINDRDADGRDMSWLWDVDFTSLRERGVTMVSGIRAWDMALRLGYDGVPVGATDTDLQAALTDFLHHDPTVPKRIYCTYTAMLALRHDLARVADVPDVGVGA